MTRYGTFLTKMNAKMNRYNIFLTVLDRFKNHIFY
jgi:hypothetical protein